VNIVSQLKSIVFYKIEKYVICN